MPFARRWPIPGSVGVIAPDADVRRLERRPHRGRRARTAGSTPTTATTRTARSSSCRRRIAKGLEFDRVVVVEPAAIADAEPDLRTGLRRLYVVLTRAVSELTVVHASPLPRVLR